jgi:hypothetical protein
MKREDRCEFNVAKPWIVVIEDPSIRDSADELAHYMDLLRIEAGVKQTPPLVLEMQALPLPYAPCAVLRYGTEQGNGFSWRFSGEGLEIVGGFGSRDLQWGVRFSCKPRFSLEDALP